MRIIIRNLEKPARHECDKYPGIPKRLCQQCEEEKDNDKIDTGRDDSARNDGLF